MKQNVQKIVKLFVLVCLGNILTCSRFSQTKETGKTDKILPCSKDSDLKKSDSSEGGIKITDLPEDVLSRIFSYVPVVYADLSTDSDIPVFDDSDEIIALREHSRDACRSACYLFSELASIQIKDSKKLWRPSLCLQLTAPDFFSCEEKDALLTRYAQKGYLGVVQEIMRLWSDINGDELNHSLLHAVQSGNMELISYLLDQGAQNINMAFAQAARDGHEHVIDFLVNRYSHVITKFEWARKEADKNGHRIVVEKIDELTK